MIEPRAIVLLFVTSVTLVFCAPQTLQPFDDAKWQDRETSEDYATFTPVDDIQYTNMVQEKLTAKSDEKQRSLILFEDHQVRFYSPVEACNDEVDSEEPRESRLDVGMFTDDSLPVTTLNLVTDEDKTEEVSHGEPLSTSVAATALTVTEDVDTATEPAITNGVTNASVGSQWAVTTNQPIVTSEISDASEDSTSEVSGSDSDVETGSIQTLVDKLMSHLNMNPTPVGGYRYVTALKSVDGSLYVPHSNNQSAQRHLATLLGFVKEILSNENALSQSGQEDRYSTVATSPRPQTAVSLITESATTTTVDEESDVVVSDHASVTELEQITSVAITNTSAEEPIATPAMSTVTEPDDQQTTGVDDHFETVTNETNYWELSAEDIRNTTVSLAETSYTEKLHDLDEVTDNYEEESGDEVEELVDDGSFEGVFSDSDEFF